MALLGPELRELGLSAWAVAAPPSVATHDLDIPRIGYVHSWTRTQDEGWWRAALDTYGIPYTYFADQKLRDGNLRAKYDVLLMPHIGGSAVAQVNGMARTGNAPLPYKKTDATPNLAYLDSSDDIRGGMGIEGLSELVKFVAAGRAAGDRRIDGDDPARVRVDERHHRGGAGAVVRARVDRAREDHGCEEPDCLRLCRERSAGLLQSVAGPERRQWWWRGGRGAPPAARGVRDERRVRPEHHAERHAAAHPGVRARGCRERRSGGEPPARRHRRSGRARRTSRRSRSRSARSAKRVRASSCSLRPMRASCCCQGRWRAVRRWPVVRRRWTRGSVEGHVILFAIRPFWRWQTQGTYSWGSTRL